MLHKNIPYRRYQDLKHKKEAVERLKIVDGSFQYNNPFWYGGRIWKSWEKPQLPLWERGDVVGIHSTTPCRHSGFWSGNPRKRNQKTLGEIRNGIDLYDQLEELA